MSGIIAGAAIAAGGLAALGGSAINYQSQRDQLRWQKQQYASQMMREDNAVQRRVADLRKAGLSPTLAAGQAAQAGPTPQLSAPQFDTHAPSQAASATLGLIQQEASIAQTNEQRRLIEAQKIQTNALTDKIPSDIALQRALAASNYSQSNLAGKHAAEVDYNLQWKRSTGQGPHPSQYGATAHDAAAAYLKSQGEGPFGPIASPAAKKLQDKIIYERLKNKWVEEAER